MVMKLQASASNILKMNLKSCNKQENWKYSPNDLVCVLQTFF